MSEFHFAASVSDIGEGEKLLVEVDERLVILFQVDGDYYCLDDTCTHDGGTLSGGEHSGYRIACPRHGAKFDIRTGQALTMPATQPTGSHEVKVKEGDIMVRLVDR